MALHEPESKVEDRLQDAILDLAFSAESDDHRCAAQLLASLMHRGVSILGRDSLIRHPEALIRRGAVVHAVLARDLPVLERALTDSDVSVRRILASHASLLDSEMSHVATKIAQDSDARVRLTAKQPHMQCDQH